MTTKKPELLDDKDLDQVRGGYKLINVMVTSFKDDNPAKDANSPSRLQYDDNPQNY